MDDNLGTGQIKIRASFDRASRYITLRERAREDRKEIEAALLKPSIKRANRKVINYFWSMLTGRPMTPEERRRAGATHKKLFRLKALQTHQWYLAFLVMIKEGGHLRMVSGAATPQWMVFEGTGTQELSYFVKRRDRETGRMVLKKRILEIPKQIQYCLIGGDGSLQPYRNKKKQIIKFNVSESTWQWIANLGRSPQQPLSLRRRPVPKAPIN
jgi:hypothetical protein